MRDVQATAGPSRTSTQQRASTLEGMFNAEGKLRKKGRMTAAAASDLLGLVAGSDRTRTAELLMQSTLGGGKAPDLMPERFYAADAPTGTMYREKGAKTHDEFVKKVFEDHAPRDSDGRRTDPGWVPKDTVEKRTGAADSAYLWGSHQKSRTKDCGLRIWDPSLWDGGTVLLAEEA